MGAKKQQMIVIECRDQADMALQRIGQLQRFLTEAEAKADEEVDVIRTTLVEGTELQRGALKENEKALRAWTMKCEKHWVSRTLELVFGKVWVKKSPPKIVLNLEEETVVERLRARGMRTCIRVIEEVNKEVLANYDDKTIEAVGCTRKQGKDKFYYECKAEEVK